MPRLFYICLLCFCSQLLSAQFDTYILNDTICCVNTFDEKEIDINQDGVAEIRVVGTILTDVGYYFSAALSADVSVSKATSMGAAFESFAPTGDIALGGVGCLFWSDFNTGDPNHYIGIQQVTGMDTLWAYVEIEFSEADTTDNSCWDARVIVLQSVISTIPNQALTAGEFLTATNNQSTIGQLPLFPNPSSHFIRVPAKFIAAPFQIHSFSGQLISKGRLVDQNISTVDLAPGVYWLRIIQAGKVYVGKFLKQ